MSRSTSFSTVTASAPVWNCRVSPRSEMIGSLILEPPDAKAARAATGPETAILATQLACRARCTIAHHLVAFVEPADDLGHDIVVEANLDPPRLDLFGGRVIDRHHGIALRVLARHQPRRQHQHILGL